MKITQAQINTFDRVGIPYQILNVITELQPVRNRFTGETAMTSYLVAECIRWVYRTSDDYEAGIYNVRTSDFDRVRYFVLAQDSKAYNTCLD